MTDSTPIYYIHKQMMQGMWVSTIKSGSGPIGDGLQIEGKWQYYCPFCHAAPQIPVDEIVFTQDGKPVGRIKNCGPLEEHRDPSSPSSQAGQPGGAQ